MTSTEDESPVVYHIPTDAPSNPALQTGALVSGATLLINGLTLFAIPISTDQKVYLISLITFVAPLVAGAIIRGKVFSPKTVEQIEAAYKMMVSDRDGRITQLAAQASVASALKDVMPRLLAAPAPQAPPPPSTRQPTVQSPATGRLVPVEVTQPSNFPAPMPRPAPQPQEQAPAQAFFEDPEPGWPAGYNSRHRRAD